MVMASGPINVAFGSWELANVFSEKHIAGCAPGSGNGY